MAALRSGVKITLLNDANQAATPLIEGVLTDWKTKQPGISVEWLRPGGQVNLTAMVAAGTPPDLFSVDQNGFAALAKSGDALALDPYLRRDKLDLADYFPASLDMGKLEGRQHGLPRAFNCGVLYTNLSHFEASGITPPPDQWGGARWGWAEFLDATRRLSIQGASHEDSRFGADLLGGIGFFWAFAYANGGALFNADMTATRIAEPPIVETVQFLADLIHRHRTNPTPEVKAKLGDRDIFFRGQATMQLIGASNVNLYQAIDQFKWDWRPLPAGKAGAKNWGGGNTFGLAGKSQLREEAWTFFKHLTSQASVTAMASQYFPARRSSLQAFLDAEAKAGRPPANRQMVVAAMQNAVVRPNHPRYAEVQTILDEELGTLWKQGGAVQAAADAAKRRIDPILQAK
ncbi:MAG TPA: extracellular solute-binding protein [Chloroflexota bacterium]|nr:extracellular solute-binding protein [Chloroflexota bacterium]